MFPRNVLGTDPQPQDPFCFVIGRRTLNLCVVGDNVAQEAFASIDNKAVGEKTLKVINLTRLRGFEECQALYISQLMNNVLLQLLSEIKNSPMLTIGEIDGFAELGGMVELDSADGKTSMAINHSASITGKLNISSRILNLAKIVGKR
jgi:hypothetical protein